MEISTSALPFDSKGSSAGLCGADFREKERIVKAAGPGVFHGNGAINSVAGAGEVYTNGFGDIERRVREHNEFGVEITDAHRARGSRASTERRENESQGINTRFAESDRFTSPCIPATPRATLLRSRG